MIRQFPIRSSDMRRNRNGSGTKRNKSCGTSMMTNIGILLMKKIGSPCPSWLWLKHRHLQYPLYRRHLSRMMENMTSDYFSCLAGKLFDGTSLPMTWSLLSGPWFLLLVMFRIFVTVMVVVVVIFVVIVGVDVIAILSTWSNNCNHSNKSRW